MKLKNCPPKYYDNCRNAQRRCRQCRAGGGKGSALFYDPIDPALAPHPAEEKDPVKSKRAQQGRRTEKDVEKRLVRRTSGSGARFGDGDLRQQAGDRELRIEHKDRGQRKSFNLTLDEYRKGQRQGIDVYAVTIEADGKQRTMYIMDEETYLGLTHG